MNESQDTIVQLQQFRQNLIEHHQAQHSTRQSAATKLQPGKRAPFPYQPQIELEKMMGRWQLKLHFPKHKLPVTGEAFIWQTAPGEARITLQSESSDFEHQLELSLSRQSDRLTSRPTENDQPDIFRGCRISKQLIRFYPEIHSDEKPEHIELVQLGPNQWQIIRYQFNQGQVRRQQTFSFTRYPVMGATLLS